MKDTNNVIGELRASNSLEKVLEISSKIEGDSLEASNYLDYIKRTIERVSTEIDGVLIGQIILFGESIGTYNFIDLEEMERIISKYPKLFTKIEYASMTFEEIIKLNDSNPEVLGKIAILNISKENYRLYADNFNGTEDNEYEETLRLIGIDNYGWFLDEEIPFFKNLSETAKRQLRYGALVYTRAGDGIVDETMIYSFNFLTHIPLDVIQNLRQSADTCYLMTNELGDKDKAEAFISKSRCINISLDSDNADFAKNLELFSSLNLEDFNGKSITIHLSSLDEEINLKQIADLSDKFQSRKLEISINIIDSYNGDYDYITFDDILKNVHTDIFTMRDYLEIHNPQSMLNGIKRDRNLRIDSDDLSVSYKGQITNPLYDFKSIILHLKETHCEKLCLSEISINEISKWGTFEHSILKLDFCDFRSNEAIRNFILLFPNLKEITFEECGIEGSNVLINTNMSIFDEFRDEVIIKFIG